MDREYVSEEMYNINLDDELPLLREACSEVYPVDLTPKKWGHFLRMTIVIVGKQHHTRFYLTREEDTDLS